MVHKSLFLIILAAGIASADTGFKSSVLVTETDNSPSCVAGQIKFAPGSVTCNGLTATVATGHVSSGTIDDLYVSSLTFTQAIYFPDKNNPILQSEGTGFPSSITIGSNYPWSKRGVSNIAIGMANMTGATGAGSFNVVSGVANLQNVAAGSANFITGLFNANAISNGSNNNLYGGHIIQANCTICSDNMMFGTSVGTYLTNASKNAFAGNEIFGDPTAVTANDVVALGYQAHNLSVDVARTVSLGSLAGKYTTRASSNVLIGYDAGNATASVNTNQYGDGLSYIGYQTGQSVSSGTVIHKSIALGFQALVDGSNQAQIGGSPGSGNEVEVRASSITAQGGWFEFNSRAATFFGSNTPTKAGRAYFCSNCVTCAVGISTAATGVGAYADISNRSTACK